MRVIHTLWYRVRAQTRGGLLWRLARAAVGYLGHPMPSLIRRSAGRDREHLGTLSLTRLAPLAVARCPLSPRRSSTHRWPCRLPASARLTLAAPPEVLADVSQQAARHTLAVTLKLMSPASLACTGPTPGHLDSDSLRSHLHKRDPRPFAPAFPLHHTHRRIATTTTHTCRASSPIVPPPSPPRRDHARYQYGVHRK